MAMKIIIAKTRADIRWVFALVKQWGPSTVRMSLSAGFLMLGSLFILPGVNQLLWLGIPLIIMSPACYFQKELLATYRQFLVITQRKAHSQTIDALQLMIQDTSLGRLFVSNASHLEKGLNEALTTTKYSNRELRQLNSMVLSTPPGNRQYGDAWDQTRPTWFVFLTSGIILAALAPSILPLLLIMVSSGK